MEISIIIPVFNAEKYLQRCLGSIIKALGKISGEIIVVDNGSSDKSIEIINKYSKQFPKLFKILKCETWGAAAARNMGVEKARGKYIWFIDADDEITPDAIKKLLNEAHKTNADFVMLGATKKFLDGHIQYLKALNPADPEFKGRFVRSGLGPWQVIIKRKWYIENNFAFKEGIIHEDMEMMPALILYTDNFAAVDEPLYYYYETPGSVLHKNKWDPHYLDIFPALGGVYGRFKKAKSLTKYHDTLEWFFIWNLLIDSANDFTKAKAGHVGFKRSREMLKQYFPNWRKNKIMKRTNLKTKIKIKLNYYK